MMRPIIPRKPGHPARHRPPVLQPPTMIQRFGVIIVRSLAAAVIAAAGNEHIFLLQIPFAPGFGHAVGGLLLTVRRPAGALLLGKMINRQCM